MLVLQISFVLLMLCSVEAKRYEEFESNGTSTLHLRNIHRKQSLLAIDFQHFGEINVTVNEQHDNVEIRFPDESFFYVFVSTNSKTNMSTYSFHWKVNVNDTLDGRRQVCFHYGRGQTKWYSTYEEAQQSWPMDTKLTTPLTPFVTGDIARQHVGSIVNNVFYNTDGFALIAGQFDPNYLRRDWNGGDPVLCLAPDNIGPYRQKPKGNPLFSFYVRSTSSLRSLYDHVRRSYDLPHVFRPPNRQVLREPIWSTRARFTRDTIDQNKVIEFARALRAHGFRGQIEIDGRWEEHYGDLVFDKHKFPQPAEMIKELHAMNFTVSLWVYTFVETGSLVEKESKYFVKKHDKTLVTADWWLGKAKIVNIAYLNARMWFVDRLKALKKTTQVDTFKFDGYQVGWLGDDFEVNGGFEQRYPNFITEDFIVAIGEMDMVEARSVYRSSQWPVTYRMFNQHWPQLTMAKALRQLVPKALTLSVGNYAFMVPNMIVSGNENPSKELLMRWLEAVIFMPVVHFSMEPWRFDQPTLDFVKKYLQLRQEFILPRLLVLADEAKTQGLPIIRPLWYNDDDEHLHTIDDQFLFGPDILVAPVVKVNQTKRQVYLPGGVWTRPKGQNYTGPLQTTFDVGHDELLYFIRLN